MDVIEQALHVVACLSVRHKGYSLDFPRNVFGRFASASNTNDPRASLGKSVSRLTPQAVASTKDNKDFISQPDRIEVVWYRCPVKWHCRLRTYDQSHQ
jgi:hypothetical protein